MTFKHVSAAVLAGLAMTAGMTVAPATAGPLDSLFGSAGSSDSGSSNILDTGSAMLGSSGGKKQQHYGKLGRAGAPNGVKSINVWVYSPKAKAISPGVYPRNSHLGVRWNSTIDAGPVVEGNECKMGIRLSGPKVPKKSQLTGTKSCTSRKTFLLRAPGEYSITVTDGISGASNAIKFTVQ